MLDFNVSGDPTLYPHCARVPGYTWGAGGIGGALGTWTGTSSLPSGTWPPEVNISGYRRGRGTEPSAGTRISSRIRPFNKVSAAYIADGASGPVEYLNLDADRGAVDPNSIETTLTHNYTVTVGLSKPLSIANWDDDPTLLRDITGPSQYTDVGLRPTGNTARRVHQRLQTFRTRSNYDDHDGRLATRSGETSPAPQHEPDAAPGLRLDGSGHVRRALP